MQIFPRALTVALLPLAFATAAHAFIPPSYKIVVVAEDNRGEAQSRALVEAMSAMDAFFWDRTGVSRDQIQGCLAGAPAEPCVREALTAQPVDPRATDVVIIAEGGADTTVVWTCIGRNVDAPARRVDLEAALFGAGPARTAALRAAMECISTAASHAGR